jgi:hypothetical protein
VTVEKVIPRDTLYLSVDSLSVYRYLNQGTCRPINSIGITDRDGYKDLADLLGDLVDKDETPYGAFMRLYLDGLCGKLDSAFCNILNDRTKAARLILATLNPILFETLAFYLCLDLGLIPETANGKGLDVIDVRARGKTEKSMESAIARLKQLEVKLHADLENSMKTNHSISIQCKAYSGDNAQGNDFLMFRRGDSTSVNYNVLLSSKLLEILQSKTDFQYCNAFFDSQIQTIKTSLGI